MANNTQNNTDALRNFTVYQDGAFNEALALRMERDERRDMLQDYAREIGREIAHRAIVGITATASFAGSVLLELLDSAAQEGRR